jgi:hypothetical protein
LVDHLRALRMKLDGGGDPGEALVREQPVGRDPVALREV